jgi:hypothetical protein
MAIELDRTLCYNCRHPMFAHDSDGGFGCSQECEVEIPPDSGLIELAPCGCMSPEPTSPYNDQFWFENWDQINKLVDILGCTRWQASMVLWSAMTREGYTYG